MFTFPDRAIFRHTYSSTSKERGLRRVVPAAVATTQAETHAQQQLVRDLEVERADMRQRRRPHSFGEVERRNPQPCRRLGFCTTAMLLYSNRKSNVRACGLIPTYHTGGASLSSCRPPISEGHQTSMVCSRSRPSVRCGSALRAWSCAAACFVSAK